MPGVARDLCRTLAESEHYAVLAGTTDASLAEPLVAEIERCIIETASRIVGVDFSKPLTLGDQCYLLFLKPSIRSQGLAFLQAMDQNMRKYLPVLVEHYQLPLEIKPFNLSATPDSHKEKTEQ